MDFDGIADRYDSWYKTGFGRYANRLEKNLLMAFIDPLGDEGVLDVGCGTGTYALEFVKLGLDVVCLDSSRRMLKIARTKSGDMDMALGCAEDMPFRDDSFDLVVGVTLFEFLKKPEEAVWEMRRVLKPGGRIILGVLNKHSLFALYEGLTGNETYTDARFYSPYELNTLGVKRWDSTLFAFKKTPGFMLDWFSKADRILSKIFKPFGAFIVAELNK